MSNTNPQATYNQYKLRKIKTNEPVYGITIPKQIAEIFEGVKFNISISGNNIILKSGLDLVQLRNEIDKYTIEQIQK